MYLEYYSLERPPFRITPDPALFFTGGAHGRGVVLEALLYAIQSGEGILKVVGEVGSGKTMLCRMLEQRLPDTVEVVYLANPKLTPHDILYAVAFELKLDVDQDTARLVLMQKLQSYLLEQHAANRSVLVIIEEAQSMPLDTLEEIRLFSNLETHQHKLMQIILFGQPELDKNLQDKNIRQLRERITHSFYLSPLTADEVSDYLRHRLQAAGCPAPQIFSKSAEKLIAKASGGLTRRINILADKSMLAAYSESATSTRPRSLGHQLEPTVQVQHVKAAIKDSDYKPPVQISPWIVGLGVLLLLMSGAVAVLLADRLQAPDTIAMTESVIPVSASAEPVPASATETETTPAEGNSVVADTVPALQSEPAAAAPVVAEPVVAEPVVAEPVAAQAVVAESVVAEPEPIAPVEASETAATEQPQQAPVQAVTAAPDPAFQNLPEIIQQRRVAFAQRNSAGQPANYTLQVVFMAINEVNYIESVLNSMNRSGLLSDTYVCLSQTQNGYMWRVLYGLYPNVEAARSNVRRLPSPLQSNEPFAQNLNRLECITPGEEQ